MADARKEDWVELDPSDVLIEYDDEVEMDESDIQARHGTHDLREPGFPAKLNIWPN